MVYLDDEPVRVDVLAGARPPEDGERDATSRSTCAATARVQLQELMDVIDRLKDGRRREGRARDEDARARR